LDTAKIPYGIALVLAAITGGSMVYSKYKNGKDSRLQTHTYVYGLLTFLVIGASVYLSNAKNTTSKNVVMIANESNAQLKQPVIMRNGFRMDPIQGYENTLKFTFTFLSAEHDEIDQVRDNLASNNMAKNTCISEDANVYLSKGINLEYVYFDLNGNNLSTYKIKPEDCVKYS
jgi:hypothetical protein